MPFRASLDGGRKGRPELAAMSSLFYRRCASWAYFVHRERSPGTWNWARAVQDTGQRASGNGAQIVHLSDTGQWASGNGAQHALEGTGQRASGNGRCVRLQVPGNGRRERWVSALANCAQRRNLDGNLRSAQESTRQIGLSAGI